MIDLVKQKFGRLTIIRYYGQNKWNNYLWLCLCNCGKDKIVRNSHLINGEIKSCGCLKTEKTKQRMMTHGHTKNNKWSGVYQSWSNMITRCTNSSSNEYKNYGGRGITVCQRWLKFENFLKDMGERPRGHQIDRINNDKGYYLKNCRWTTPKQQARNRRTNRLITFNGKTKCLANWAEDFNISQSRLRQRLYRDNWSMKRALTTPVKGKK